MLCICNVKIKGNVQIQSGYWRMYYFIYKIRGYLCGVFLGFVVGVLGEFCFVVFFFCFFFGVYGGFVSFLVVCCCCSG